MSEQTEGTIVGVTPREVAAVADAYRALTSLRIAIGWDGHSETIDALGGLLERMSSRYGVGAELRSGKALMAAIWAVLPPEGGSE